ncbi:hypothetical protein [Sulfurisphaera ohwakuensis]|uniref:hypothetical protein n=1 Tax=Sulfurisphaera ohwakuensis TaxID=69656 RepID=UPI0036F41990
MIDERTLEIISSCWVRFRRVYSVEELDDECKHIICTFLLKIAEDDGEFATDLELQDDLQLCQKFERKEVKG